jgi:hypothetical protein
LSAKRPSRRERRAARNTRGAAGDEKTQRKTSADGAHRPAHQWDSATLRTIGFSACLVALVSAVYFQARTFGFISLDDPQYVSANPEVANGLTLAGVKWAFFSSASFYWHPLTWLSHMLDVEMYGMNAGSHHMTSVALHAASSVILFLALSRLTGARGRSFFVAALFAVHPLHVESVVWIAERKDVLSTLFWMCTLYAYAGYALDPRPRRMALVTILFAFGLMAKPMILTLPFVLLLVDIWPLRRAAGGIAVWMRLVKEKIPLMILAWLPWRSQSFPAGAIELS